MMRRREAITLLGGAAAWPVAARAQPGERVRRIGIFISGTEADPEMQARVTTFRAALERLGWSEGRNVRFDIRYGSSAPERYQAIAKELVALQPDVIFAHTTPIVAALKRETTTVPVVFVSVSDPVGSDLVASLARPGGNITGLLLYEASITGKWLAMLKEIAPGLARVALMANPRTTPYDSFLRAAEVAAPALAIELVPSRTANAADIERTIESLARTPNGGLLVLPDGTSILHRDLILVLTARYRLPTVYGFRFFVTAGGLMSYGADILEQHRQAAALVDRILHGSNPADLPVQAPTRYQTVVNLKTARALGFSVPPGLLVAADEVIE
jgi:putative tryptophan/tyrosine transport system substrate-binding protein